MHRITALIPSSTCPDAGHVDRVVVDSGDSRVNVLKSGDVMVALTMGHAFYAELPADETASTVVGWVCRTCRVNTLRCRPNEPISNRLEALPIGRQPAAGHRVLVSH
jgi:hypothetical protein